MASAKKIYIPEAGTYEIRQVTASEAERGGGSGQEGSHHDGEPVNLEKMTSSQLHLVAQGTRAVRGIAVLNNEIFIIRQAGSTSAENKPEDRPNLEVYECGSRRRSPTCFIPVTGLKQPVALIASEELQCLLISDKESKCIFKIDVANGDVTPFHLDEVPAGISIVTKNKVTRIYVAFPQSRRIAIYDEKGEPSEPKSISLYITIENPHQCIPLQNDQFLVRHGSQSQTQTQHRVCIVEKGKIFKSYAGPGASAETEENKAFDGSLNLGQIWMPECLAVDTFGNILIADSHNNCVHMLNSKLEPQSSKNLTNLLAESDLCSPLSLHLDLKHASLYIGDATGKLYVVDINQ